jgi:nicotinic acid mononucleotide adenylyltransferase
MWKDDDQVDARLRVAYLKAFVAYVKAYVSSTYSSWQSMKSMTVSSMECVMQRQRSHPEHLGTA